MPDSYLASDLSHISQQSFPTRGLQMEIPKSDFIDGVILNFQPITDATHLAEARRGTLDAAAPTVPTP